MLLIFKYTCDNYFCMASKLILTLFPTQVLSLDSHENQSWHIRITCATFKTTCIQTHLY